MATDTALPRLDASTAAAFAAESRPAGRGMQVAEMREAQRLAGMVPDPDPEKHLALKGGTVRVQVGGQELEIPRKACSFLPPPVGPLIRFVCGVQDRAPYENFTVLGVTFMRRRFEVVSTGEGSAPETRVVPNIIEMAGNQARAVEIVARQKRVTGLVATDKREPGRFDPDAPNSVGRGGVVYERRTAPIAAYLVFHPVREEADLQGEVGRLQAEVERLKAEAEAARAESAREREAAAEAVRRAVPAIKGKQGG